MNIENRLQKLEADTVSCSPCFCGKTFVDVMYGKPDAMKPCLNCRRESDLWKTLINESELENEHQKPN